MILTNNTQLFIINYGHNNYRNEKFVLNIPNKLMEWYSYTKQSHKLS